mmetsp:Transcript_25822/g.79447  ORF Transcript_25822/g.79447 Transcript_25822/m.79447 type:complete len:241 (+) Transcript_25822:1859-2581(+)
MMPFSILIVLSHSHRRAFLWRRLFLSRTFTTEPRRSPIGSKTPLSAMLSLTRPLTRHHPAPPRRAPPRHGPNRYVTGQAGHPHPNKNRHHRPRRSPHISHSSDLRQLSQCHFLVLPEPLCRSHVLGDMSTRGSHVALSFLPRRCLTSSLLDDALFRRFPFAPLHVSSLFLAPRAVPYGGRAMGKPLVPPRTPLSGPSPGRSLFARPLSFLAPHACIQSAGGRWTHGRTSQRREKRCSPEE